MSYASPIAFMMCGAATCLTWAQPYPAKPVRIVTLEPGGGIDIAARITAQAWAAAVSQPVIVDNRGGASGVIAAQTVAKAPPDGYTLLFYGNPLWLLPLLKNNVPYDAVRDFAPITLATSSPITLVVHPTLPVQSVKELIALAKAQPGKLNYGSAGSGTTNHLGMELFKSMADINVVHVPYKGSGPALNDLLAGRLQLMFPTSASAAPHIKAGRLRALAVGNAQPSALVPGVPTVAASGLPGYEMGTNHGVFVPAATPRKLIAQINQQMVQVLRSPELGERLLNAGLEAVANSPEQFALKIKTEIERMGKVIREAGIRAD